MTLIVAASNGSSIVVAADTRFYEFDRVDNISRCSTVKDPKIRQYGNFIVGISGQSNANNVIDYLLATEAAPNPDIRVEVMELISKMGAVYRDRRIIEVNSSVLLAGFDLKGEPYLATWTANNPSDLSDNPEKKAIGCACGVALHFTSRSNLKSVSDDNLPTLVYFSIAEVCHYENRIAKPIDMAIINENGAAVLGRQDVSSMLDKRCQQIADTFYGQFNERK